jgi:dephospho-CoA kinase
VKRIGLTGNIGTGKSTVAKIFGVLGVPVYPADLRARDLMNTDAVTRKIRAEFGESVTDASGGIDRKRMANLVFSDPAKLARLNALIHPMVETDFLAWCEKQNADVPYALIEAAILFESGFDTLCDAAILVTAPQELCIERVMQRDSVSRDEVLARIARQWPEERKKPLAAYTISNDGNCLILPQVLLIHQEISRL